MNKLKFIFGLILLCSSLHCHAEIFITEIYPNPPGQDSKKEWIEIFNDSVEIKSLEGWSLSTSGKTITFEEDDTINPKNFFRVYLSLKNTDETIKRK